MRYPTELVSLLEQLKSYTFFSNKHPYLSMKLLDISSSCVLACHTQNKYHYQLQTCPYGSYHTSCKSSQYDHYLCYPKIQRWEVYNRRYDWSLRFLMILIIFIYICLLLKEDETLVPVLFTSFLLLFIFSFSIYFIKH